LLDCGELTDQLTHEEYNRMDLALDRGYFIDQNSDQDAIIRYYQLVEMKRVKLIRSRVMTDLDVICNSFYKSKNSFACLKAYTEVHGAHAIKPTAGFKIFPYTEESFSWLAHTLITTEYVGEGVVIYPFRPISVSNGSVQYWDISKVEKYSIHLTNRNITCDFPEYLQISLAFWNYYEGDRMYFD
jgi:hypothetical protein